LASIPIFSTTMPLLWEAPAAVGGLRRVGQIRAGNISRMKEKQFVPYTAWKLSSAPNEYRTRTEWFLIFTSKVGLLVILVRPSLFLSKQAELTSGSHTTRLTCSRSTEKGNEQRIFTMRNRKVRREGTKGRHEATARLRTSPVGTSRKRDACQGPQGSQIHGFCESISIDRQ
jgi:hypothetical protein